MEIEWDGNNGPEDGNGNNDANSSINGNNEIGLVMVKWESKKQEIHSPC